MENKQKEEKKEREKKVRILDQIDNLRVIQNNHFMVGKLEDALKEGEKIIALAKELKVEYCLTNEIKVRKVIKGRR